MEYKGKALEFFIILSVDVRPDENIVNHRPPIDIRRKMDTTEGDEWAEYDIWDDLGLGHGKHRKYVGELTYSELKQLTEFYGMFAEDVETGGSLTGMGWLPAISFSSPVYGNYSPRVADNERIVNAYVTPFVEDETLGEDDWEAIRKMIIEHDWDF